VLRQVQSQWPEITVTVQVNYGGPEPREWRQYGAPATISRTKSDMHTLISLCCAFIAAQIFCA
jgi:hypothetical protein